MKIEGDTLTIRPLVATDSDFVHALFSDWSHDGHDWHEGRTAHAMRGWLRAMRSPEDIPCLPTSRYRGALVIEDASGPIGVCVRTVRGREVKHNISGVNEVQLETVALLPEKRGQGIVGKEFSYLASRHAFEVLQVDASVLMKVSDMPATRKIVSRLKYQETPAKRERHGKRFSGVFTRAEWGARVAANPEEAGMRFVYTP